MGISLNDQKVEITCPTCGKNISQTVAWFKQAGQRCPNGCGTSFDTTDFKQGIAKAEKMIEDTFRKMRDAFK